MSIVKKTSDRLLSNDKVIQYLHGSSQMFETTSPNDFISMNQQRFRSGSENDSLSSSSSSLSQSGSSLSDTIAQFSTTSFKDLADEDLDFNIIFDQSTNDEDEQYLFNKNNADTVTSLDEPIFSDYFCQKSHPIIVFDDKNDDTTSRDSRRPNFIHDSTYTLCSPDCFPLFSDSEIDAENNEQLTSFTLRSNSFSVLSQNNHSTFVKTTSKKVVRFADMLGLDLESIRYMTPPDQTVAPIIHECLRLQFGQLNLSKTNLDIPNIFKRSLSSTLSLKSPAKQYNLVSKYFTSPSNIIPLIYKKNVLLECLYTKDSTAYGTIRVHNCTYDKRVFVRLTNDEWQTTIDIQATHSMNYSHDNTDTFIFQITLPKSIDEITSSTIPKRLLFAIYYQASTEEFWDNNQGWNYVLDVLEK